MQSSEGTSYIFQKKIPKEIVERNALYLLHITLCSHQYFIHQNLRGLLTCKLCCRIKTSRKVLLSYFLKILYFQKIKMLQTSNVTMFYIACLYQNKQSFLFWHPRKYIYGQKVECLICPYPSRLTVLTDMNFPRESVLLVSVDGIIYFNVPLLN